MTDMTDQTNLTDEEENDDDSTNSTIIPVDALSAAPHGESGDKGKDNSDGGDAQPQDADDETGPMKAASKTQSAKDAKASKDSGAPAQDVPTPKVHFTSDNLPDLQEHKHPLGPNDADDEASDDEMDDYATSKSRDEFTTVYDIIDQLSETLEDAKSSIFAPNTVRLDRDELTEQLDQLKTMLPVQLERASSLMRESERRLENAQAEADAITADAKNQATQIVQNAQEQAEFLADHERVTDLARQKAADIIEDAQTKATKLTQGANAYCADVMKALKDQLSTYSQDVDNGIKVIDERQRAAAKKLVENQQETLQPSTNDSEQ
ncbi:cell division protein [Bifidobacterium sp. ESL0790]|uniref:cell division protein n=1 Tax=Bifidobacterium sp. ESL0790 TaxID=2983233 RepID=UPI0023F81D9C|nr:cell division protein [Bifidobacterium sp. ESL0790]WEV72669.1 cell division protein [Bifidobacterium sp. ESL0790]